jgi:hypothetical protein
MDSSVLIELNVLIVEQFMVLLRTIVPVSRVSPSVRIMHISRITIHRITGNIPIPSMSRFRIPPLVNLRTLWSFVSFGHCDMLKPDTFLSSLYTTNRKRSMSNRQRTVIDLTRNESSHEVCSRNKCNVSGILWKHKTPCASF